MTVKAIYENGVFRPVEPVSLPERTPVDVVCPPPAAEDDAKLDAVYEVLGERYRSGRPDLAARHNEHQP